MSLLNFKAQNHPQQVDARGPRDDVDDRRTPDELWQPLHFAHRFTLDAAACAENAKVERFYDYQSNGLAQPWKGERVWCNPPFSYIRSWVEKAWREMADGCECVVMLVPANRCEQKWWQKDVEPFRDGNAPRLSGVVLRTRFIAGRTRFSRPGWLTPQKGDRPPFGCWLTWERAA
jgi:phage N-6-adenine-methyltransferase